MARSGGGWDRTSDFAKQVKVGTQNNRRIQIVRRRNDGFLQKVVEYDSDCVAPLAIGILIHGGANRSVFDKRDHLLKQIGGDKTKLPAASMFMDGAAHGKAVDGIDI